MSVQAMTWAFSLKLGSPSLKVTLLALANRVGDFNQCFPGIALLAEETDLSERTVKTCIAKLEELGLVLRTRRHTPYGYRTSNSYTLMVGAVPPTELGDQASVEEESPDLEANIASRSSAGKKSPTVRLGANFAPRPSTPKKPPVRPLEANFAPRESGPVDNVSDEAGLEATGARLSANAAPLKEEPKDLTQRSSSSSSTTEFTTDALEAISEAAALPPDDEDGLDGGGGVSEALVDDEPPAADTHEPVDLQRLLRAGIEVSLRELDARLNLSEILRRLSDAGVEAERVDVPAAAAFVLSAAARPVGDPSAYVAAAIIREPARWPWHALPSMGISAGAGARSTCEVQGHRYLDEYRIQCVRCQEERPGWREERYAADSVGSVQARAVAS